MGRRPERGITTFEPPPVRRIEQTAEPTPAATASATASAASSRPLEFQRMFAEVRGRMFGATDPVRVGRYVIRGRIGIGGMGVVYAADDAALGRRVAIKLLHGTGSEGQARGRILREAQALARLSHPNVVQIYEVGEVGRQVFVAMEFVEGLTLGQWQIQRPRSWRELLDVYVQAGRGLAAAHAVGLVHRDFKPKSECPPQTPLLPPSGRILADRGDLRGAMCRVMPRHAAVLATDWQHVGAQPRIVPPSRARRSAWRLLDSAPSRWSTPRRTTPASYAPDGRDQLVATMLAREILADQAAASGAVLEAELALAARLTLVLASTTTCSRRRGTPWNFASARGRAARPFASMTWRPRSWTSSGHGTCATSL
jgi:serine/threonine protein kinase